MLIVVLGIHLSLVAVLATVFIARLVQLFRRKNNAYHAYFYSSAALLVLSGVLLSVVGKLPITTICLESLGLVAAIGMADYALALFGKRIDHKESIEK